jgi:regulatory protein
MSTKEYDLATIVRRAAFQMLARRDYTQNELMQKLQAKGHRLDNIEAIIANLMQTGVINEPRYAENFIYSRRCKGHGPERIARELQTRGIAEETIAEHLQITDNTWCANAQEVWQKHFKGKWPTDFKERAKQMRFLQYRGFTHEQINSVFERKNP